MLPLTIVEPALRRETGHFPSIVRSIIETLKHDFAPITIYAHARCTVTIPGTRIVPFFRRRIRRFQSAWLARKLLPREGVVLFSTAHSTDYMGIQWASRLVPAMNATVLLFHHMHYANPKHERRLRNAARRCPNLIIAAPTTATADAVRNEGFTRVHEIPYPHIDTFIDHASGSPDATPTILHPGVPRLDKGLGAIADLAEKFRDEKRDIPIIVQVSLDHWGHQQDDTKAAVDRLRASAYPNLRLIDESPDPTGYASLFKGAICVLPYDRELFKERISGVTLDALRAGCPIVVTSGTWMARLIDQHHAGVCIDDFSPTTIAAAVDTIIADLKGYRARSLAGGDAVRREQHASPLREVLLAATSSRVPASATPTPITPR